MFLLIILDYTWPLISQAAIRKAPIHEEITFGRKNATSNRRQSYTSSGMTIGGHLSSIQMSIFYDEDY